MISKETSQAEHEYMNKHPPPPPINVLATVVFRYIICSWKAVIFSIVFVCDNIHLLETGSQNVNFMTCFGDSATSFKSWFQFCYETSILAFIRNMKKWYPTYSADKVGPLTRTWQFVHHKVYHRGVGRSIIGGANIHIFVFCPINFFWNRNLDFKVNCFYSLWTRIYEYWPPQLSIFRRPWSIIRSLLTGACCQPFKAWFTLTLESRIFSWCRRISFIQMHCCRQELYSYI